MLICIKNLKPCRVASYKCLVLNLTILPLLQRDQVWSRRWRDSTDSRLVTAAMRTTVEQTRDNRAPDVPNGIIAVGWAPIYLPMPSKGITRRNEPREERSSYAREKEIRSSLSCHVRISPMSRVTTRVRAFRDRADGEAKRGNRRGRERLAS